MSINNCFLRRGDLFMADFKNEVLTLRDIIQTRGVEYANDVSSKIVLTSGDTVTYTYGDVYKNVEALSKYMQNKLKIKKGDVVAVMGENRPEWTQSYLAIVNVGATVIPIDAKFSVNEIDYIIDNSKVKHIFLSISSFEVLGELSEISKKVKRMVLFDKADVQEDFVDFFKDVIGAYKYDSHPVKDPKLDEDDLAAIIYTSGTTGTSKGVMLTHKNIVSNIKSICSSVVLKRGDRMLSILPLHHTFEATAGFLAPFYVGITVVYLGIITPKLIVNTIKNEKITKMIVVPLLIQKIYNNIQKEINKSTVKKTLVALLMKKADLIFKATKDKNVYKNTFEFLRKKAGLDSIEFFVSGAASLQDYVAEGMESLGFTVLQGYGLTEASPVVSVNRLNNYSNKSVGSPIDGVKVEIHNPDKDGFGEIIVKGNNVMKGYYHNPEETAKVMKNGWLFTGDIGYIDESGFIHITGRRKNIIVTSGGKNVYPEELEDLIALSPFVLENVVSGMKISDNDRGECPYAYIVPNLEEIESRLGLKNEEEEKVKEIIREHIRELNSKLPEYKKIKGTRIIYEELPKTSTRKVKRHLIKEKIDMLDNGNK